MHQPITTKIVVDHGGRAPDGPAAQQREQEVGRVGQVEGDELARDDAEGEEEAGVAEAVGVRLGPGVGAAARPEALFGGGEPLDLGFEVVPEGEAVVAGWVVGSMSMSICVAGRWLQ